MTFFLSEGVSIAAIRSAVPDNLVSVQDFEDVFGREAVEKFSKSTGIYQMYKALPEQTASDLAYVATEQLLTDKAVDRSQIGALIFVTQSPDYRRPATACVLQKRLGLSEDCAAVDVGLGCSGFVYGLQLAESMMASSDAPYALLLLGETASKLVDPHDRSIAMMYGDAGAAVLLERNEEARFATLLRSDGDRFKSIILPAGGFRDMYPDHDRFLCSDGIERSLYDIFMDGTAVFSFSITDVPRALDDYFAKTETSPSDYDVFAFHQANHFIIRQLIRKLGIPKERVPLSLGEYGNTGGVSIPLTLCDAYAGTADDSMRVLACGFGIGLSWGVTSFHLDASMLSPVIKTADYYQEGKIVPGTY